jgi:hypothetical protein
MMAFPVGTPTQAGPGQDFFVRVQEEHRHARVVFSLPRPWFITVSPGQVIRENPGRF